MITLEFCNHVWYSKTSIMYVSKGYTYIYSAKISEENQGA